MFALSSQETVRAFSDSISPFQVTSQRQPGFLSIESVEHLLPIGKYSQFHSHMFR